MMNAINPNDLLAKRVIDIAKYNRTGDSFIKGTTIELTASADLADNHSSDGIWQVHRRINVIAPHPDLDSVGRRLEEWYQAWIRSFTTPYAGCKRGRRGEGECGRNGP
jgi:hypothetical protein